MNSVKYFTAQHNFQLWTFFSAWSKPSSYKKSLFNEAVINLFYISCNFKVIEMFWAQLYFVASLWKRVSFWNPLAKFDIDLVRSFTLFPRKTSEIFLRRLVREDEGLKNLNLKPLSKAEMFLPFSYNDLECLWLVNHVWYLTYNWNINDIFVIFALGDIAKKTCGGCEWQWVGVVRRIGLSSLAVFPSP